MGRFLDGIGVTLSFLGSIILIHKSTTVDQLWVGILIMVVFGLLCWKVGLEDKENDRNTK